MNAMLLVAGAGFLGGAMNALAGGGSFVTLPALIAAGVPPVQANASSTVALLPGGLASAWAYRAGLGAVCNVALWPLVAITVAGGLAGAVLLLVTPARVFDLVLPWLLLIAALTLMFGAPLREALRRRVHIGLGAVLTVQFLLGIYGGYFGGAVGIMMMAVWTLFGATDLKALAGPRTLLVSAANAVAVVAFVIAHAVQWPETIVMLVGATVGGWGAAALGRRAPPGLVRAATLLLTACVTATFFARTYG
ncbi:MAG: sulfite exporter TauE/SafE family protein [Rhodospirillales bacterium]|nr:sulfite exporter TauE/SafE family protein [Rhodospirillales bacterium]MBN8897663.1 sulfite exporter TauE/SafE family protein [Rhodospirillales bacterium]MBN8907455.1 sulfite exporter TauE/SafE family protein [Rhodospirillales bacterium]